MASEILGRTECPIKCGHTAAHVKRKTDKQTGTAYPYIHCRGCGCQLHIKNAEQAGYLAQLTRPEKLDAPEVRQSEPAQPIVPPLPKETAQQVAKTWGLI